MSTTPTPGSPMNGASMRDKVAFEILQSEKNFVEQMQVSSSSSSSSSSKRRRRRLLT